MPISSSEVNGLMQQQMSMFQMANPGMATMQGYGYPTPPMAQSVAPPLTLEGARQYNMGMAAAPQAITSASQGIQGALPWVGMGLSLFGGKAGGAVANVIDPFSGAFSGMMRGISAGSGWGAVGRGALGMATGAIPGLLVGSAIQQTFGHMATGAAFQRDTSAYLQNAFRFSNNASRTGMGFSQGDQRAIGNMLQQMGTQDVMTTPRELLSIMSQGTDYGWFRGVQSAKDFRRKFTEIKNAVSSIAKEFNLTLSEAMPFLKEANNQGFWSAQDIMRHTQQVKSMQANTGMSTLQAQQLTGMGAQMVRGMGGTGEQGAQMMARAQSLTGAALFGGQVSSRLLSEAGFGTGAQGAQNFGQMLAGMSANFARSGVGRWALAAMMNQSGTGLDADRLARFTSGGMRIGEMGALARRNVSGGRAYDFVNNEEDLRGELAAQVPMAMLGFTKSLLGDSLYGQSSRDKLVTSRLIQRFLGGSKRQAELVAKLARDLPRLQDIETARSEMALDTQAKQQDILMNDTIEGAKRQLGRIWRENISGPLEKAGGQLAHGLSRWVSRASDKLFGTSGRNVGLSDTAVRSMVSAARTGDYGRLTMGFGSSRLQRQLETEGLTGVSFGGGMGGALEGFSQVMSGQVSDASARAAGYKNMDEMLTAQRGEAAQGVQKFLQSGEALSLRMKYGETLSTSDYMKLAGEYSQRIRQGKAGRAAQQALSGDTPIARLAALQGDARGGLTGINVGGDARSSMTMESRIEDVQEKARGELATLMDSARIYEVGGFKFGVKLQFDQTSQDDIQQLENDVDAAQGLRLFAEAEAAETPSEKARLRQQARESMRVAAFKDGLGFEARKVAAELATGTSEKTQHMVRSAAALGRASIAGDIVSRRKITAQRMERVRSKLGNEGLYRLKKAAKNQQLNEALRAVLNPGSETAEQRIANLDRLASKAAASPEQASQMLSVLAEQGLDKTELGLLLQGSLQTAGDISRYSVSAEAEAGLAAGRGGRRDMRRAVSGVSSMLGQLGIADKFKEPELRALITGKGGKSEIDARERLMGLLGESMGADKVNDLIKSVRGGLTADEMTRLSLGATGARVQSTYSERVAKTAGLNASMLEMTGQEGSMSEIGKNIALQTTIQREMLRSLETLSKTKSGLLAEEPKQGKD